jgi:hypothetical protein
VSALLADQATERLHPVAERQWPELACLSVTLMDPITMS